MSETRQSVALVPLGRCLNLYGLCYERAPSSVFAAIRLQLRLRQYVHNANTASGGGATARYFRLSSVYTNESYDLEDVGISEQVSARAPGTDGLYRPRDHPRSNNKATVPSKTRKLTLTNASLAPASNTCSDTLDPLQQQLRRRMLLPRPSAIPSVSRQHRRRLLGRTSLRT